MYIYIHAYTYTYMNVIEAPGHVKKVERQEIHVAQHSFHQICSYTYTCINTRVDVGT